MIRSELREGVRLLTLDKPEVERDANGQVVWAFKRETAPVDAAAEEKLLKAGLLKPEEANFQIHDVKTDKKVAVHRGSVRWNEYRKKYVCLFDGRTPPSKTKA